MGVFEATLPKETNRCKYLKASMQESRAVKSLSSRNYATELVRIDIAMHGVQSMATAFKE